MDADHQILDQALNFVRPVLYARVGNQTWKPGSELSSFMVVMPDGAPLVRVNDEVGFWSVPVAARSFEEGEELSPSDLITRPAVLPEANLPYIAGTRTDSGWKVAFNLDRPHPKRLEFLDLADEFAKAAEATLDQGLVRPFISSAFHAVEHLARAELLSYSLTTEEVIGARKHTQVASAFHLWAHLGNTDEAFAHLLNRLSEARRSATYLDTPLDWSEAEARAVLLSIQKFQRHVEKIARRGEKPDRINVVATRTIEAGTLVANTDAALRPLPRKRKASA